MQFFSKLFFFFCLPGIICHFPLHSEPKIIFTQHPTESYSDFSPWNLLKPETLSFDHILDFVEMIENTDKLEEIFTEQQIEEIEKFLVFLMRNGIRDWDTEAKEQLEEDIAWMKGEPNNSSLAYEYEDSEEEELAYLMSDFNGYRDVIMLPAVYNTKKPQVVLCKGKLKKFSKNFKRAIRKHKKEIIIAAVVVVVATVVIIATAGTAAPEAVIASGAAMMAASDSNEKDHEKPRSPVNKPGEVWEQNDYPQIQSQNSPSQNVPSIDSHIEEAPKISPPMREIIQQTTYEIKEDLSESIPDRDFFPTQDEPSLLTAAVDKARETGSHIAHEVYNAVTDQLSVISDIAGAFTEKLPEVIKDKTPFEKDSRESFQEMVEAGHKRIDTVFETDQSHIYSTEGKEVRDKLTIGMLPPPGSIGNNIKQSSKFYEKNINHIFRQKPGHLPDTPTNRKLLLEVAGNPNNFLGIDKHGNSWHAKIQKDGTQVWSISRNGEIRDAGVNKKAQIFHKETGLSNNVKPKQK